MVKRAGEPIRNDHIFDCEPKMWEKDNGKDKRHKTLSERDGVDE